MWFSHHENVSTFPDLYDSNRNQHTLIKLNVRIVFTIPPNLKFVTLIRTAYDNGRVQRQAAALESRRYTTSLVRVSAVRLL